MNKTKLATAFVLVLLLSVVVGVPVIKVAKANPYGMFRLAWRDINVIRSPQNKTYNGVAVPVNFTVEHLPETSNYLSRYILQDMERGQSQVVEVTLENTSVTHDYSVATGHVAKYESHLSNLEAGSYKLTVQRYYESYDGVTVRSAASVIFSVNPAVPDISDLTVENKTYHTHDIPFTFIVGEPVSQITYSLDNQRNVTLTGNTLTGLSEDSHSLTVYAKDFDGNTGSSETAYFTVDTTPPKVVLMLENTTYYTSEIPLNFIIDEVKSQIDWKGYTLDSQEYVTISKNVTLRKLSDGAHNLTVYVRDMSGNVGSSSISFTIDTVNQPAESVDTTSQEAESADALNPKAEQLPTTSDVTPIVAVAALSLASLGLLVYFTKIKKTNKPEK